MELDQFGKLVDGAESPRQWTCIAVHHWKAKSIGFCAAQIGIQDDQGNSLNEPLFEFQA